jgi:hypothetical protein
MRISLGFGRTILCTAPLAALLVGCGSLPDRPNTHADDSAVGTPHVMLTAQARAAKASAALAAGKPITTASSSSQLTYRGGPVLQNVKVFTVFWGNGVQFSGTGSQSLNGFYTAVTNSAYFDWLSEYNTSSPVQKIGRGSFAGSYNDTGAPKGSLKDDDLRTHLSSLIDAGTVPAPDANTLYALHFAPGISITMSDGSGSCQVFCAYHNSYTHNGKIVYYSVIPDQGGSCAGGCGSDPSTFNNTCSVSSHELIEAVTDADVAEDNLAWYNDSQGEIGDICNGEQGSVAGYTVQKEWSNSQGSCIVTNGTTCTPSCTGKACGSDGCGGSCGTCSGGTSCNSSGQCVTTTCTPSCSGKQCGDDGCGGSCGSCASGQTCGSNGQCTGGGGGSCAHPICSQGGALKASCDPCATKLCAQDSYCCSTSWDDICVGEVNSICGQTC